MTITTPAIPPRARASHYEPASTIMLLFIVPFVMASTARIMAIQYEEMDVALPGPTQLLMAFAGSLWTVFLPSVVLSLLVLRAWSRASKWSIALNYFCFLLAVAAALFSIVAFVMPTLSIVQADDQWLETWSAEHTEELKALADQLTDSSLTFVIVSKGTLIDSDPAVEDLGSDPAVQSLLTFAKKYSVGYCYFEASVLRLELEEIESAPGVVWLESRDGHWKSGSRGAAG